MAGQVRLRTATPMSQHGRHGRARLCATFARIGSERAVGDEHAPFFSTTEGALQAPLDRDPRSSLSCWAASPSIPLTPRRSSMPGRVFCRAETRTSSRQGGARRRPDTGETIIRRSTIVLRGRALARRTLDDLKLWEHTTLGRPDGRVPGREMDDALARSCLAINVVSALRGPMDRPTPSLPPTPHGFPGIMRRPHIAAWTCFVKPHRHADPQSGRLVYLRYELPDADCDEYHHTSPATTSSRFSSSVHGV